MGRLDAERAIADGSSQTGVPMPRDARKSLFKNESIAGIQSIHLPKIHVAYETYRILPIAMIKRVVPAKRSRPVVVSQFLSNDREFSDLPSQVADVIEVGVYVIMKSQLLGIFH